MSMKIVLPSGPAFWLNCSSGGLDGTVFPGGNRTSSTRARVNSWVMLIVITSGF